MVDHNNETNARRVRLAISGHSKSKTGGLSEIFLKGIGSKPDERLALAHSRVETAEQRILPTLQEETNSRTVRLSVKGSGREDSLADAPSVRLSVQGTGRELDSANARSIRLGVSGEGISAEDYELMRAQQSNLADGRSVRFSTCLNNTEVLADSFKKQTKGRPLRLSMAGGQAERDGNPTLRLARALSAQGTNNLIGRNNIPQLTRASAPALLVSYFYLATWDKIKDRCMYRDWVMDSGAFSAHASGASIDLNAYMDKCTELLCEDQTLTEVFALDVIGDHKQSLKNAEKMWSDGIEAIPCFHYGSPWDALIHIAQNYPKIAIGGIVGLGPKAKLAFLEQCFARVWPKKIHGFGIANERICMALPFHSVDATNWELAPCAFGNWKQFGKMSVRGSKQNLRGEVEHYLNMERKLRVRWRKEMALLETL